MSRPPTAATLTTPRLELRSPVIGDLDAFLAYVTENRDHLAPWEPHRGPEYRTRAHWERLLPEIIAEVDAGRRAGWLLRDRDEPGPIRGICSIHTIVGGVFRNGVLGYSLAAEAEGRGLMTEALRAVIDHAFGALDLHRLEANVRPENTRSLALVEKLGFRREGYSPRMLHIDGDWRDHVRTALLAEDLASSS